MSTIEVSNDPERSRYELRVDGEVAGFAQYVASDDSVRFVHTEVLPEHGGKGYGARLATDTLADVRRQSKRIVADCDFIAAHLKKQSPPTETR